MPTILPPDPAREERAHALLFACRRQIDGRAEPLYLQLDYESGFDVRKIEVGVDVNLAETAPIEVAKDGEVMRRLERFVDAESPAALRRRRFSATWPARCASISTPWPGSKPTTRFRRIDAPMFGTILHAAVQTLSPGSWARSIPARPCGR